MNSYKNRDKSLTSLYKTLGIDDEESLNNQINAKASKFAVVDNQQWENQRVKQLNEQTQANIPKVPKSLFKNIPNVTQPITGGTTSVVSLPDYSKPTDYLSALKQPKNNISNPMPTNYYDTLNQDVYNPALDKMSDKVVNSKLGGQVVRPFVAGAVKNIADLGSLGDSEEQRIANQQAYEEYRNGLGIVGKVSELGGNIALNAGLAAAMPIANSSKVVGLTKGISNPILNTMAREGIENAAFGALTNLPTLKNEGLGEYAKNVALEGAGGALFGGAIEGASKGLNKLKNINNPELNFNQEALDNFSKRSMKDNNVSMKINENLPDLDKIGKVETPKIETKIETPNFAKELEGVKSDDRNFYNMRDMKNTKTNISDNGELGIVIKQYAGMELENLRLGTKGGKTVIDADGKRIGQPRVQSETIEIIKNQTGESYDKIKASLERISKGEFTNTLDRKIELILDDAIINGTRTPDGLIIPPNESYIEMKQIYDRINKGDYSDFEPIKSEAITNTSNVENPVVEPNNVVKNDTSEVAFTNATEDGEKLSRNANVTFQNKVDAPQEVKDMVKADNVSYIVSNNKEDNAKAIQEVLNNPNAYSDWINGKYDKEMQTHVGAVLREQAIKDNNYRLASDITDELSLRLTNSGKEIQAIQFYNSQTPEGMVVNHDNSVKKLQEKALKDNKKLKTEFDKAKKSSNADDFEKFCKNNKIPFITDEQLSKIKDYQEQILNTTDVKEKNKLIALRNKLASQNVPKSFYEKMQNYRYMSMLFNPKTLLTRNPMASGTRMVVDSIGNPLGAAVDKALSKKTGQRTLYKNSFEGSKETVANSFDKMNFDFKNGTNVANSTPNNVNFGNGSDGLVGRSFQYAMNVGDVPFADLVSNAQIKGYMKESGITDISQVPDDIINLAIQRGKENNFQNKNAVTPYINKLKEAPVIGKVVDATMPFVNTNLNIVQDTFERSPLGLASGLIDAGRTIKGAGKLSDEALQQLQKKAVDKIQKGAVGSAVSGLGYALGDKFTGGYSDDSKIKALEKEIGLRENAIDTGNMNIDLSQLSVLNPNLLLGAELKKNGFNLSNLSASTIKQLESSLKSSPFSGLNNFMTDLSDYGVGTALANTGGNYANQFIPTALKQTNNLIDPIRRETYSKNALENQKNIILNGIPGLSQTLQPQVDTFGNEKEKYPNMNGIEQAFNTYINPFLTSNIEPTSQQQNALDIAYKEGSSDHLPNTYSKTIKGYKLTSEELAEFKKLYGRYSQNATTEAAFKDALSRATKEMETKLYRANKIKKK